MSKIILKDNKRAFAITSDLADTLEGSDLMAEAMLAGLSIVYCK